MNHALAPRHVWLCLFVLGAATACVMLRVELPLLLGWNAQWEERISSYRFLLHVHAVSGSMALFAAPVQFIRQWRLRRPRLHRIVGRIYVLAIAVAAPTAIWIALFHLDGSEKWMTCAQASLWLYATLSSIQAVLRGRMDAHRFWMARSYALTCTFILSRFVIDVMHIHPGIAMAGNAGFILLSSAFALMSADALSNRQIPRGHRINNAPQTISEAPPG